MTEEDMALSVIKEIYQKKKSIVSFNLISKCYEIQKKYLFEKDRNIPMDKIKVLIATEVNKEVNS